MGNMVYMVFVSHCPTWTYTIFTMYTTYTIWDIWRGTYTHPQNSKRPSLRHSVKSGPIFVKKKKKKKLI